MNRKNSVDETLMRRLRAVSCPLPSEGEDELEAELIIEIIGPEMAKAYQRLRSVEDVFGVRITNISYSCLACEGLRAYMPWSDRLSWLGDPRVYTPGKQTYRLESGREFPCADVLNHGVFRRDTLQPHESWEGILLAQNIFDSVPFRYPHASALHQRRLHLWISTAGSIVRKSKF